MSRIAYVDGVFAPHAEAAIHIEDRGNQFADAIYEVWAVIDGALADSDGHFARMKRSLKELRIAEPMSRAALESVLFELVRRNRIVNGLVYLQISRGSARRDHSFPAAHVRPTLIATAKRVDMAAAAARAEKGVGVITTPDIRWARRDIKSVSLLPNVLARQAAKEAGAAEAWMIDAGGFITEGSASNAWIVTKDGALVTRAASETILNGVTRLAILRIAKEEGLQVEERAFTLEEAFEAREAFISSASSYVTPVVTIDGRAVANGAPGHVAERLRAAYIAGAKATALRRGRRG